MCKGIKYLFPFLFPSIHEEGVEEGERNPRTFGFLWGDSRVLACAHGAEHLGLPTHW